MRDITILHLYNDTLDLYGDYFNVTALRNRIVEMGGNCTLLTANLEDEDIPLEQADLVYMGHGKARNLAAVAPHFARFGQRIIDAIVDFFKNLFGNGSDEEAALPSKEE